MMDIISSKSSPKKNKNLQILFENNDIETQFSAEVEPVKKVNQGCQTKTIRKCNAQIQSMLSPRMYQKGIETEVTMSDITLMLQFKTRSVQKIINLEEQLKTLKSTKELKKTDNSFIKLPERP
jgi:hypothetical protein